MCIFLPNGLERGFVVGAMYGRQTPPVQSGDKWHRTFSDGATIEYDRASHALAADIPGTATIKCKGPITLEAPTVYIRGTLVNTAKDGNPGKSVFSGGMEINDGGLSVPDADVVAAGVSLASHTNDGVQPGAGTSSHPSGGSAASPGTATIAAASMSAALVSAVLEEKEADVKTRGTDVDKLIMCLPNIAQAKAAEYRNKSAEAANAGDTAKAEEYKLLAEAWEKLALLLEKWIAAQPSNIKAVDGDECVWLDWDWLMKFPRFSDAYHAFTVWPPNENNRNILNEAAKKSLGKYLCEQGYMQQGKDIDFDFIRDGRSWRPWQFEYHTSYPVKSQYAYPDIEGSTVVLGGFSFHALASGKVEWISGNEYRVNVGKIAVVVWDTFNFDEETGIEDTLKQFIFGVGQWRCEPPKFDVLPFTGSTQLNNSDFRKFRDKKFGGSDFMVMTEPHLVATFPGESYKYVCHKNYNE